jgi:uncharacterized protein (PEP-CTERM system associated)
MITIITEPEGRLRSRRKRAVVYSRLLCLSIVAAGHSALAQSVAGTGGDNGGTNAVGSGGIGTGSAGRSDTVGTGPIGASPSVLPPSGIGALAPDVRLGNLGGLTKASGVPPAPGGERAWTITPQVAVVEEYSSTRAGGTGRSQQGGEFISSVQPSIAISGDTSRLQGSLSYAPQIEFHVPDGNQNRVDQFANARLLATLVPQTLFLDLRGGATVQAIAAGQAPSTTTNLNRSNTTQEYDFSASPYALHRFGSWGTGEIGGTIARSTQNSLQSTGPQTAEQATLANLLDANNENTTIYGGHVAFTTGEAFSRYNGSALAQATSFDGTGVLQGAARDTVTLDNGYAVTRNITALVKLGYERIRYAGTSPVHISDAILNGGIRLTPNADSSITIRYGHEDGLNSLTIDASYAPTARTRLYARYSTGLTTEAEQLQNALATSDLDSLGNPVDHSTGAPLVNAGNFFGTQNSLFRTSIASVTGTLALPRDTISLSVNSQSQTLISASNPTVLAAANTPNGLGVGSSRGVYGAINWSHELRPDLQSTLYTQYGVTSGGGISGNEQLFVVSAVLSYALSATLSGQLQYSYNRNFGENTLATLGSTRTGNEQSLFLVSLVKSF